MFALINQILFFIISVWHFNGVLVVSERISARKCAEYAEAVYENVTDSQTGDDRRQSTCATTALPFYNGGEDALPREYPHMAILRYFNPGRPDATLCHGSLISERFVLTTALCANFALVSHIILGLQQYNVYGINSEVYYVSEQIVHPDFKEEDEYNGIGLIRLKRDVEFNAYIRPACLSEAMAKTIKGPATVIGYKNEPGGLFPEQLLKDTVKFFTKDECSAKLGEKISIGLPWKKLLCAGPNGNENHICGIDAGSPLQIYHDKLHCMHSIIGVVQRGNVCGKSDRPSLYTRVSGYLDWIEQHVWPNPVTTSDVGPFTCEDDSMIDGTLVCDGIEDCADGSDEKRFCQSFPCQQGFLRCDYGACVYDKSTCRTKNQTLIHSSCQIKSIPANGYIALAANPTLPLTAHAFVMNYGVIEYGCYPGYHLIGASTQRSFCLNGEWSDQGEAPICEPRCNITEISSITYMTNCYKITDHGNVEVGCSAVDLVEPGVVVGIACKYGYRNTQTSSQQITCDSDGRWNNHPRPCQQVCGEEGAAVSGYIVSGAITDNRHVPWHVGVYRINDDTRTDQEPIYVCGGTIVNARMVVSAMHCFWDRTFEQPEPTTSYRVVAGKFYRGFNDPREMHKYQVLHIQQIAYPDGYNDYNGLYGSDIAVLILDKYIEFRPNIAPACINFHYEYDEKVVQPGAYGLVAGWGLTKVSGSLSDELKSIRIPVVNRTECRSKLDNQLKNFLTPEKFCAGILNQNAGVCIGDSGGGLLFLEDDGNRKVYYLRGVVSSGARHGDSCDPNKYAFYTNVAHFSAFIEKYDLITNPSRRTRL